MAAKDSDKKQVFDVSHPGTSPPSATSKPVITGSGTMMKDPMMQDKASEPDQEADDTKTEANQAKKGLTIQPLHDDVATDDASSDSEQAADTEQAPKTEESPPATAEAAAQSPLPEPEKEDSETEEAEDTEELKNAIVDAVIDQTAGGKNSTKQTPDDADSSIQEHIQNKTYFVKISHASNSNALSAVVIIVLLLVIAVVFYVADQRGIITLPF